MLDQAFGCVFIAKTCIDLSQKSMKAYKIQNTKLLIDGQQWLRATVAELAVNAVWLFRFSVLNPQYVAHPLVFASENASWRLNAHKR